MTTTLPGPSRIIGIDVARGVAITGMIGAHILGFADLTLDPASWHEVLSGRPTILFFLLGGLSIGLLSGSARPPAGRPLVAVRLRIVVRALLIGVIGVALQAAPVVGSILLVHATLFLLCGSFLLARPRTLLVGAAVGAAALPALLQLLGPVEWRLPETMGTLLSAIGLLPVFLVGLALGRTGDWSPRSARRLIGVGLALGVVGYGSSAGLIAVTGQESALHPLLDASSHTGTTFELVGSTGVALVVLGVCLLLPARGLRVLAPLRAAGAMPLTSVVLHALLMDATFVLMPEGGQWLAFLIHAAVVLGFATAWRRFRGPGPIERVLALAGDRFAPRVTADARTADPVQHAAQ